MLTQPITLITGTPGAGKTLRAIYEALELQKEGREVYALGIDGLDSDLIESLPDDFLIEDWVKLPEGSVLFIDEAHKYFPVRTKDKVPDWMSALTEIRHQGKSIVLITQDPRNIDAFVRRLVGEHLHLTRKAGFNGSLLRTFPGVSDNPDDYHARSSSSAVPWVFPKTLFKHYKSASLHTIKPKIPFKIWLALIFTLCLIVVIPVAIYKFKSFGKGDSQKGDIQQSASLTPKTSAFAVASNSEEEQQKWFTADDYVKAHKPLIPAVPWSAPVFQGLPITTVPDMHCMIWDDGGKEERCNCYNEQAVKDSGVPDAVCYIIAREGIYNPYRRVGGGESAKESVEPFSAPPPSSSQ